MLSRIGTPVALLLLAVLLALPQGAAAQQHPTPRHGMRVHALDTSGDHPLGTVGTFTGPIDAAVVGLPFAGTSSVSGTFSLSGLPTGATTVAAWLVVLDYAIDAETSASATFAGNSLGSAAPAYVDPGYPLDVWSFSVTSLVAGNGNYSFSVDGISDCYGATLVVVYSHPGLPTRDVVVNLGAEDLENASSTTSFGIFSRSGQGRLIVFTGADDSNNDGGEALAFNGVTIPGVVFSQNLGPYSSLITETVNVVAGVNTATVTTGADQFGWDVAVLVGPGTEGIPTASGVGLALLALALASIAVLILVRRS